MVVENTSPRMINYDSIHVPIPTQGTPQQPDQKKCKLTNGAIIAIGGGIIAMVGVAMLVSCDNGTCSDSSDDASSAMDSSSSYSCSSCSESRTYSSVVLSVLGAFGFIMGCLKGVTRS